MAFAPVTTITFGSAVVDCKRLLFSLTVGSPTLQAPPDAYFECLFAPGAGVSVRSLPFTRVGNTQDFVASASIPANTFFIKYGFDAIGKLSTITLPEPVEVLPAGAFQATHRDGEFLIKDFTKLVGIEKVSSKFKTRDIAFIDTQTRSMLQASSKCKAIQNSPDPTFSLIYRTKANKNEEWSARITPSMREALGEIARIIDFAATDIRTLQKFDLTNKFFQKTV
jgi:hypothetical protein